MQQTKNNMQIFTYEETKYINHSRVKNMKIEWPNGKQGK